MHECDYEKEYLEKITITEKKSIIFSIFTTVYKYTYQDIPYAIHFF